MFRCEAFLYTTIDTKSSSRTVTPCYADSRIAVLDVERKVRIGKNRNEPRWVIFAGHRSTQGVSSRSPSLMNILVFESELARVMCSAIRVRPYLAIAKSVFRTEVALEQDIILFQHDRVNDPVDHFSLSSIQFVHPCFNDVYDG